MASEAAHLITFVLRFRSLRYEVETPPDAQVRDLQRALAVPRGTEPTEQLSKVDLSALSGLIGVPESQQVLYRGIGRLAEGGGRFSGDFARDSPSGRCEDERGSGGREPESEAVVWEAGVLSAVWGRQTLHSANGADAQHWRLGVGCRWSCEGLKPQELGSRQADHNQQERPSRSWCGPASSTTASGRGVASWSWDLAPVS
eukprot:scaffold1282_cov251-Pinguiococcus_pyrenoidosus.AAC.9